MISKSSYQEQTTYCLKPISEAKDCKEHCHPTFRNACLDRYTHHIYGVLSNDFEENDIGLQNSFLKTA
ncbi:hypothetical protein P148_SR1C00001G0293 [candidate division SR1 bacterium RAAC1_SR1_1]|nr:hypothetical protein P148_SR1C00001G0293 [candidate division SR1 bacterium RAAC1_SR1_1]